MNADSTVSDKNILEIFLPMPRWKELTLRSCECKWDPAICCEDHDLDHANVVCWAAVCR
jgi:hypothetical protein